MADETVGGVPSGAPPPRVDGGQSLRVLVCGSRTYTQRIQIRAQLDALIGPVVIIEGGAKGADNIARAWAMAEAGAGHEQYPADWEKDGKAAGPIRNQRMLDEGKPDLVMAFVDKPLAESKGTADMVRRARKAGIRVEVFEPRPSERIEGQF